MTNNKGSHGLPSISSPGFCPSQWKSLWEEEKEDEEERVEGRGVVERTRSSNTPHIVDGLSEMAFAMSIDWNEDETAILAITSHDVAA